MFKKRGKKPATKASTSAPDPHGKEPAARVGTSAPDPHEKEPVARVGTSTLDPYGKISALKEMPPSEDAEFAIRDPVRGHLQTYLNGLVVGVLFGDLTETMLSHEMERSFNRITPAYVERGVRQHWQSYKQQNREPTQKSWSRFPADSAEVEEELEKIHVDWPIPTPGESIGRFVGSLGSMEAMMVDSGDNDLAKDIRGAREEMQKRWEAKATRETQPDENKDKDRDKEKDDDDDDDDESDSE